MEGGASRARARIGRITRFDPSQYPAQLAGEVDGFDASDYIEQRLIVQTDHWTHMALAATQMALDDASYDPEGKDPYSMSVITASGSGGNEFGQKEIQNLWGKGPSFVGAYQSIAWFYAATTGQISIKHGMKGPCGVVVPGGRRRARGALALPPHHPARASTSSSRGGTRGADRAVRADLPDDERAALRWRTTRATPTARSTRARTATSRARAARS